MAAYSRSNSISLAILAVVAVFYVLVVGKALLVPLAIAIMIWYIINALSRAYARMLPGKKRRNLLTTAAAVVTIGILLTMVINMIDSSIGDVVAQAPIYKQNLDTLLDKLIIQLDLDWVPNITQVTDSIEVAPMISSLAATLTGLIGKTTLILIYVLFLLLEQKSFDKKIVSLFPEPSHQEKIRSLITRTQSDIQTYVWIKTLTSMTTGLASYFILLTVGVDFAQFWAFTIFLLNFIPTIGSIIATLFPAILALIQFDTLTPFLIVLICVGSIQFAIGSVLEPRLMGNSLNLSPLVVLLSLALWGSVWGIAGMFLCVPLTVICVIILSHFPQTRGIAILLSGDGQVRTLDEPGASGP
jgi:AI-2 transport protein TqsA